VSLIRKFWFYFSPKHFLIGAAATTKEVVLTAFPLWQSQRFHRRDTSGATSIKRPVPICVF